MFYGTINLRHTQVEGVIEGVYLVESTSNIDWRLLDDIVDNLREGCKEIRGIDLRIEEDLWGKESFIPDVDGVFLVDESTFRLTFR